jgi:N utilization substance protein B
LYQWQLAGATPEHIVREFTAERELPRADLEYFRTLICDVAEHFDALVSSLRPCLDRAWSAVGPVERAILLIGAYELLYCPQLPRRVVLNEAVELAKMFGPEESFRYINAVLDCASKTARPTEV